MNVAWWRRGLVCLVVAGLAAGPAVAVEAAPAVAEEPEVAEPQPGFETSPVPEPEPVPVAPPATEVDDPYAVETGPTSGAPEGAEPSEPEPLREPVDPATQPRPADDFEAAAGLPVGAEVESLRTEFSRTFVGENGELRVEHENVPIHYDAGNGQLETIDPTLEEVEGGARLRSRANAVTVELERSGQANGLGRVVLDDEHWVAIDLAGRDRGRDAREVAPGREASPSEVPARDPAAAGRAERPSTVAVERALPSVDVQLSSTNTGLKETLVLHDASAPAEYVYALHTRNLTPELRDDGSVVFRDEAGADRLHIPVGWARDSDPEAALPDFGQVTYELRPGRGRNRTELVMRIDEDWLRDPERQFPVLVDPTTDIVIAWQAVADTYVLENFNLYVGQGSYPAIAIGRNLGLPIGEQKTRAFLRWDLSRWNGRSITGADLYLDPTVACSVAAMDVYRVLGWWSETSLVWSNKPQSERYGTLNPAPGTNCSSNQFFVIYGLGALVNRWTTADPDDREPNYGLELRSGYEPGNAYWVVSSREDVTPGFSAPSLDFAYVVNWEPDTPTNLSPVSGALVSTAPTFSARYSDRDGDSGRVDYFVGNSSGTLVATGSGSTVPNGGTSTWTPPAGVLQPGQTYTWTAQARDSRGLASAQTASRSFTVARPLEVTGSAEQLDGSPVVDLLVGDTVRLEFAVRNPNTSGGSVPLTISNNGLPFGVLPITGSATIDGTPCGGSCTVTPLGFSGSVSVPAGATVTFAIDAMVLADDLLCADRQIGWTGGSTPYGWVSGAGSQNPIVLAACGTGLGVESWWSMVERSLGPAGSARVNAANGNLVVSHTDLPPVPGRGRLAYVVRRTYNSQAPGALALGPSIGERWSLNVATAGETLGLVTPTGLVVPDDVLASLARNVFRPGLVLVDRDGTRHTFTPRSTGAAIEVTGALGELLDLTAEPGSILERLVGVTNGLLSGNLTAGGVAVCLDTTYTAPPGVELAVWRFIGVETPGADCGNLPAPSDTGPLVLGYAAVRPDRTMQIFSIDGRLQQLVDPSGNRLRYAYDGPLGALSAVWEPSLCEAPTRSPSCRVLSLDYGTDTVTVTDPAGRTVTYSTTDGQLTSVTAGTPDVPAREQWDYTYDGLAGADCGPVAEALCSVSAPSQADRTAGSATRFEHADSAAGPRVVSIAERHDPGDPGPSQADLTTAFAYTPATAAVVASTEVTRGARAVRYDGVDRYGRPASVLEADPSQLANNQAVRFTNNTWDAPDVPGTPANETVSCGPAGLPALFDHHLCEVERGGAVVSSEFAPPGYVMPPNPVSKFVWTPEGELLVEQHQAGPGVWLTTTHGYRTIYTRRDGSTVEVVDDATGVGAYNAGARPSGDPDWLYAVTDRVETISPRGNVTTWERDRDPAAAVGTVGTGADCGTGNSGLVCTEVRPLGVTTTYRYDQYGQRTEMRTPKAHEDGRTTDPTISYVYFDGGSDLSGTTAAAGWLRAVVERAGPDPAATHFVAYGYDAGGNVFRQWDRNATDRHGVQVGDLPGTVAAPGAPDFVETRYGDGGSAAAAANPWRWATAEADQLGNLTTYVLDSHGNRTSTTPPRGNAAGTSDHTITETYDARDQVISRTLPATPSTPWEFRYDEAGLATETIDPNGNVRRTLYDEVGRATEAQATRGPWSEVTPVLHDPATGDSEFTPCRRTTAADAPVPADRILCTTVTVYDGADRVLVTRDGAGAASWTSFDQAGRATSQWMLRADGLWHRSDTVYDADGNVVDECTPRQATDEPGTPCADDTAHFGAHHGYDALGRRTHTTRWREAVDPVTGARTGGWDHLETTTSYDADGNATAVTDPRGVVTDHEYDYQSRLLRTEIQRDAATRLVTTRTYDASGNVVAAEHGTTTAENVDTYARTSSYRYDAANRLVDSVENATDVSASANDDAYNASDGASPANLRSRRVYDPDGNVVATYGPRAFVSSVTDPDERYMRRVDIDPNGRATATWWPLYDSGHRTTNTSMPAECPEGGPDGGPQAVPGASVAAWPAGVGVCRARTEYDPVGNPVTVHNPTENAPGGSGRYTTTVYTDDYLPLATETPNPAAGTVPGEPLRITSMRYSYDGAGRQVQATDALGWSTETHYTADGLVGLTASYPPGGDAANPESRVIYTYDANGQTTSTATLVGTDVTEPGRVDTATTSFNADGSTYETSQTVTGHNASAITWRYGYDPAGNTARVWSPSAVARAANNIAGAPTINTFTGEGLLATTTEPVSPDGTLRRQSTLGYDSLGNKVNHSTAEVSCAPGVTDPSTCTAVPGRDAGSQSWTWTPMGWPMVETGRNGETINYTWLADGSLFAVEDSTADAVAVTYRYLDASLYVVATAANSISGYPTIAEYFAAHADGTPDTYLRGTDASFNNADFGIVHGYNDARSLTSFFAVGSGFSFDQWLIESDRAGRPVEMLDPQGRISTYNRHVDGTLTEKVLSGSSGPVDTWAYDYDALDRVVSRTRSGADARTESFHYDQAGRLDVVDGQQVGYDPNGNRTSNGGSTTTFRADNSVLTAGADTYTQTPFGAVDAAGCRNNDYDGFDRLSSVDGTSCATSSNTSFTYDGLGRQIRVTTTGTDADTRTLRYVGETGTLFSDIGNDPAGSARYVNTPAGQPVAVSSTETTPTIQLLHSDGHQNTVLATSPSAAPCAVDLDPWGEPRDDQSESNPCQAGDSPANRWWNHGRRDVGTGTYTFGARTYDPTTATWLQPDNSRGPAAPTDLSIGTDPMLANRYSYVNGDPVNLTDPWGHYACTTQRDLDGGCGYGEYGDVSPGEGDGTVLEAQIEAAAAEIVAGAAQAHTCRAMVDQYGASAPISGDLGNVPLPLMQAVEGCRALVAAAERYAECSSSRAEVLGCYYEDVFAGLWNDHVGIDLRLFGVLAEITGAADIARCADDRGVVDCVLGGIAVAGSVPGFGLADEALRAGRAARFSRLVPGGGLAAHELAGGHTLSRHLGLSHADLLARLAATPKLSGASAFASRATAEAEIARLLSMNAHAIDDWLRLGGSQLVLRGQGMGTTGVYVAQGTSTVRTVSGVQVVLRRSDDLDVGYRIHTAYPAPT